MTALVGISLGSNVGDRLAWLRIGAKGLERLACVGSLHLSRIYESEAVGCEEPYPFLNAAACFRTEWRADALLEQLHQLERKAGRVREKQNAPRTLDLDLLFHGQDCSSEAPILPHPRLHLRRFVLAPLVEIAPEFVLPQKRASISDLFEALGPAQSGEQVWPTELSW